MAFGIGGADGGRPAGVDTRRWEKHALNSLGKEKFSFDATLMLPAKTATRTSATTVGGNKGGSIAYLQLSDAVRVMVMERSAASPTEPSTIEQLVAYNGPLQPTRRGKAWFLVISQTADGSFAVQGENWAVLPGLSFGTEKTLTAAQVDEVEAICASVGR